MDLNVDLKTFCSNELPEEPQLLTYFRNDVDEPLCTNTQELEAPPKSSILLMQYSLRHNLTQEALSDLLKLLDVFLPLSSNDFPSLLYLFNKPFIDYDFPLVIYYFCNNCMIDVLKEMRCPRCSASLSRQTRSIFIRNSLGVVTHHCYGLEWYHCSSA